MYKKITVFKNLTASHNVDPQNGFTPLCPDELPVIGGNEIVDELNKQNNLVKYKTVSKDMHPINSIWIANDSQPQFSPVEGENVDIAWKSHCISGTFGSELIAGLPKMCEYDFFVAKGFEPDLHPYSSCYHDLNKKISTGLIEWYIAKHIDTVIVAGLATNYCVGSTVEDLLDAGFDVILNLGGCRGIGSDEDVKNYVDSLVEKYKVNSVGSRIVVVNSADEIEVI